MKGLLLKDMYAIWGYLRSYLFLILFMILLGIWTNSEFLLLYCCMLASMLTVTLISYEEKEKWNVYADTLPWSRAQMVSAKYITGLLLFLSVFGLSVIVRCAAMLAAGEWTSDILWSLLVLSVPVGILPPALMLPFVYKLGAEKGRIFYLAVVILVASGVSFLNFTSAGRTPEVVGAVTAVPILLVSILLYALSWMLSIFFYRKREI